MADSYLRKRENVAHTKKRVPKRHKWFAIIFTLVLAIQCVRELIFAFGQHSGDPRIRGFVLSGFYGLVSYGVWRTFQSRNSN